MTTADVTGAMTAEDCASPRSSCARRSPSSTRRWRSPTPQWC